jgi:hypothetical protein
METSEKELIYFREQAQRYTQEVAARQSKRLLELLADHLPANDTVDLEKIKRFITGETDPDFKVFVEKNKQLFTSNDFSPSFTSRREEVKDGFGEIILSVDEPEPLEDPSLKNGIFFQDLEFQLEIQQLRAEALYLFFTGHQKTIRGYRQKFVLELEKALQKEDMDVPPLYNWVVSAKIRDRFNKIYKRKEDKVEEFLEDTNKESDEFVALMTDKIIGRFEGEMEGAHPRFVEKHVDREVGNFIESGTKLRNDYHDTLQRIVTDYPNDPRPFVDKLLGLNDKQIPVFGHSS